MKELNALALATGILGGLATGVIVGTHVLVIWGAVIAWACYFHVGGDSPFIKTITGNLFGVICGWLSAVTILGVATPLPVPVWAGIVVGVTVFLICQAARFKQLELIPVSIYGYAATFAYMLQTPEGFSLSTLLSPTMKNALLVVGASMAVGAVLAFLTAKLMGFFMSTGRGHAPTSATHRS